MVAVCIDNVSLNLHYCIVQRRDRDHELGTNLHEQGEAGKEEPTALEEEEREANEGKHPHL